MYEASDEKFFIQQFLPIQGEGWHNFHDIFLADLFGWKILKYALIQKYIGW